jgi:hypothetical protein
MHANKGSAVGPRTVVARRPRSRHAREDVVPLVLDQTIEDKIAPARAFVSRALSRARSTDAKARLLRTTRRRLGVAGDCERQRDGQRETPHPPRRSERQGDGRRHRKRRARVSRAANVAHVVAGRVAPAGLGASAERGRRAAPGVGYAHGSRGTCGLARRTRLDQAPAADVHVVRAGGCPVAASLAGARHRTAARRRAVAQALIVSGGVAAAGNGACIARVGARVGARIWARIRARIRARGRHRRGAARPRRAECPLCAYGRGRRAVDRALQMTGWVAAARCRAGAAGPSCACASGSERAQRALSATRWR